MSFDLIHLNNGVSTEEVRAEMRRRNQMPATGEQLEAYAEEARLEGPADEFAIVALGTVLVGNDGREYSPAIKWTITGFEELAPCAIGPGWYPNYRFLAVSFGDQKLSLQLAEAGLG